MKIEVCGFGREPEEEIVISPRCSDGKWFARMAVLAPGKKPKRISFSTSADSRSAIVKIVTSKVLEWCGKTGRDMLGIDPELSRALGGEYGGEYFTSAREASAAVAVMGRQKMRNKMRSAT